MEPVCRNVREDEEARRRGGERSGEGWGGVGRQKEDSMSCAMTTNSKVPLPYFYFRRFHNFISLYIFDNEFARLAGWG